MDQAVAGAIVEEQVREVPAYESVAERADGCWNGYLQNREPILIDLEISDLDGLPHFYSTQNQIIVLPKQISLKPTITLGNEHNGKAYTTLSNLRFTAEANDSDGALVGVQFYVNGDLLGAEIPADYAESQEQQPYSAEFSPPVAGSTPRYLQLPVITVGIACDESTGHLHLYYRSWQGSRRIRLSKPTMAAVKQTPPLSMEESKRSI